MRGEHMYGKVTHHGWCVDQVTKLFEGDISPHTDRSLAKHTVRS